MAFTKIIPTTLVFLGMCGGLCGCASDANVEYTYPEYIGNDKY